MAVTTSRAETTVRVARRRLHPGDALRYAFLLLVALLFLYPLYWMFTSSLKPSQDIATIPLSFDPRTLSLDNYTALLSAVPLWVGFKNTAIVILVKGGLTMFFCPLAGFVFAKYRFRGRNALFGIVLATLMLPVLVLIVPLFLEMNALG